MGEPAGPLPTTDGESPIMWGGGHNFVKNLIAYFHVSGHTDHYLTEL